MASSNIDQDKQIAAASLLALVGSVPSPENRDDDSRGVTGGTKRKPDFEDDDERRPAQKRLTLDPSFSDSSPKRVSDDESSLRNLSRSSTMSTNDWESVVDRRFSCPVTAVSTNDSSLTAVTKPFKHQHFPVILMTLLTTETSNEVMGSMFFLADNNHFVIRNTKEFSEAIMPKYFQMTKFGCFVKKLERWGFNHVVIQEGSEQHLFSHPFFHKNNWNVLYNIRYTPMRGELARKNKMSSTCNAAACVGTSIGQSFPLDHRPGDRKNDGSNTTTLPPSSLYHEFILSRQLKTELATIANIRDRSSLLRPVSETIPNSICFQSQTAMNNATKDIVAKAIDCLLHDEEHTLDLLARRGHELNANRRLSLPSCMFNRRASSFGSISSNFNF